MTGRPPALYREAHSALSRPLLARYLLAPAVVEAAFLLAWLATAWQWFFIFMGWLIVPVMIWTTMVYRNWPTGIRIDEAAVSIGAVGSPRAASRTPTVTHQSRGLFTCPWQSVEGIRVVTDLAELRAMKNAPDYYTLTNRWGTKRGMSYCNTGVLASPFMRAALVIEVDQGAVTTSRIRPARYYSNYTNGYFSRRIPPHPAPAQPGLGRAHPPSRGPAPGPRRRPWPPSRPQRRRIVTVPATAHDRAASRGNGPLLASSLITRTRFLPVFLARGVPEAERSPGPRRVSPRR